MRTIAAIIFGVLMFLSTVNASQKFDDAQAKYDEKLESYMSKEKMEHLQRCIGEALDWTRNGVYSCAEDRMATCMTIAPQMRVDWRFCKCQSQPNGHLCKQYKRELSAKEDQE